MNGFHGPVHLELQPSAWLPRAVLALHGATCAALLLAYPWSWPRTVLLCAVLIHAHWSVRAARRVEVTRIELGARDSWRLVLCDGRCLEARLLRAPWVSSWLTAFTLACKDGKQRHIVLLPDMVDGDALRRLRVRLLAGGGAD